MSEDQDDQRVEQFWETPSHDQIVEISRSHVVALEATEADDVWIQVGMHHVVLHTIGRRSGREHKCALPVWRDENGDRVVVGSFAGAEKEPDWVLNLRDRDANTILSFKRKYTLIFHALSGFSCSLGPSPGVIHGPKLLFCRTWALGKSDS